MNNHSDPPSYQDIAIAAARQAGDYALGLLGKPVSYTMKNAHDIQAEADLGAERIIIDKIRAAFPDHGIFAEESGVHDGQSEYRWIIDPLDGTINFSRRIEEFCVSIALCRGDEIILGVLYMPVLDRLIVAKRGQGAYLNGHRTEVSRETKLINCLVASDNSSDIDTRRRNISALLVFSPKVRHVRIWGSAAWTVGRIAQGQIDIYCKLGSFNYWDYAAAIIIAEESGGKVTDAEGRPVSADSRTIVVTNGRLHEVALSLIKPLLAT